jgi:hypothetical protein
MNAQQHARELGTRGRAVGVALWCSFLAASAGTLVCFAFVDPASVSADAPAWWTSRIKIYSLGFLFLWLVAVLSSALTLYITRTEHAEENP